MIVLSFILKWVANFGLKKLKMDISKRIGPYCTHRRSAWSPAAARHCSVLPSMEVNVRASACPPSAASGHGCWGGLQVTAGRTVAPSLPAKVGLLSGKRRYRKANPSECLKPHSGGSRAHRRESQRGRPTPPPRTDGGSVGGGRGAGGEGPSPCFTLGLMCSHCFDTGTSKFSTK